MQMHISINFEDHDKPVMLAVIEALSGHPFEVKGNHPMPVTGGGTGATKPEDVGFMAQEVSEVLHPMTNGELVNDVREVIPAMDAATPGEKASAIVKRLDAKYKRAATGTAAEGVRIKEDDEVVDPDGQVGIIAALYRGKAVVEYDDHTGAEFETGVLALYKGEDEPVGDEEGEAEGEAEPDPLADDEVVTRDDLRTLASQFMGVKGGKALQDLMVKHTGSSKVSAIPEEQLPVLAGVLRAAMGHAA